MKVYVASALENIGHIRKVIAAFRRKGHEITYDWTVHGSVQGEGPEVISGVAQKEARGIAEADVVLVVLPGGRGTHAELGIAAGFTMAGYHKAVIIAESKAMFADIPELPGAGERPVQVIPAGDKEFGAEPYYAGTCAFYHLPGVARVRYAMVEPLVAWVEEFAARGDFVAKMSKS